MSAKWTVEIWQERINKAIQRAADGSLSAAAFVLAMRAQEKIEKAKESAAPGRPPKSRRGLLRRAIQYAYDKLRREAVIGPLASRVGESASAHEHGGKYKGQRYPQRPFMGPTLLENLDVIPQKFKGSFGP